MEADPRPALAWTAPGTWLRLLALAGACYALGWLGLQFAVTHDIASPAWPPAGLGVAAVALWGRRALPAIVLAALLVELTAGLSAPWALAVALGAGTEAALGGWLVARAGGNRVFQSLGGVPRFGAAAFLAALPAAAVGVASLLGAGVITADDALQTWLTWYLGDLVGIVILAPALLGAAGAAWTWPSTRQVGEGLAAIGVLAAAVVVAFWIYVAPLVFVVVPPVVWIALRFGPRVTAFALLGLDLVALLGTEAGNGPFQGGPPGVAILVLQAFMVTLSLFCLALAALASERGRSARDLELRVAERTHTLAEVNLRLQAEVQERRAAEAAMAEAQRVAQMGTWRWDVTKPHAEWSAELYRIYGLDPATHVPSYDDYLTRVHPEDVERVKAATDDVFKRQKPYSHDERVRRPDGSWRHLHTWASAIADPNGKLLALVGACQDITERVAQETKFKGLLESAPDAMVIADAQGKIVLVNGQAERMFGYTRQELIGQPIELLVPASAAGRHAKNRAAYAHQPVARPMGAGLDLRGRRKDGSEVPVEISLAPLETPEGTLISSSIRDVTARNQAAHALAESLERFRALSDASPIGIVHTTSAGVVDYANKAWLNITGLADYNDPEAMRKAVHPEDQPKMAQSWRACIRDGVEFAGEMRFVRPDGEVRLTSSRAVPVRGHNGAITGFVSAVEDITERRAAEQTAQKEREARLEVRRLQEQADFKTNFLRTAAHELGTPLTPIKIQLRILRDLVARRPEAPEGKAVVILERNVDRLQLLVRDLLESARLQSGRMKLNPRAMDLAHQVHDVVETFQEPAIEAGIALDAKMPNEVTMVGDPDRITQVLYNLLSNAMKFTPAGGRVHVQADDLGETVRFVVEDNGSGFTPEQASHLFQPFSQVHDPMQTSKPGSGLGLYICRGIVEQHGGGITAYSAGPGKGARFTVSLPRVARPPAPPAVAAADKVPDLTST